MSDSSKDIQRARSIETNHQNVRGRSKAAAPKRKAPFTKGGGNKTKGGGINRALKGASK